jgi:hypothetical protein
VIVHVIGTLAEGSSAMIPTSMNFVTT